MTKRITTILQQLPSTPGVYQFLDVKKRVIYVGKAANLKSRVRSYFVGVKTSSYPSPRRRRDLSSAKEAMVKEIVDFRIITTDSEIEALLLEANLIKKFQPYYNVALRDDKSYLYVKISTEEEWPRVLTTRKIDHSGTYFGPFTSAHAVREVLRVLRKFLPYRCNQRIPESRIPAPKLSRWYGAGMNHESRLKPPLPLRQGFGGQVAPPLQGGEGGGSRRGRSCFWYHIGRCPGTCVGAITNSEYRKIIRRIILFFEGRMEELKRAMKKELGSEHIALMENVLAHTKILSVGEKYVGDVKELARVLHLPKIPERIEGYDISNIMGQEATGSMVVFVNGEPAKNEYKRFKIRTIDGSDDVGMLEEVLTRRLRHSILSPKYEVRSTNKIHNLEFIIRNSDRWPMPDLIIVDGGKAQLNAAVRTIEQYKNSVPENRAIARFSGRGFEENFEENSVAEKFTPLHPASPDIEGDSLPKRSTNRDVTGFTIVKKSATTFIPVIAVAKGGHGGVLRQKEEIYFPGERTPLKLPNNSPALHLILRVRDEAHRFAVGYHTKLRRKRLLRPATLIARG